MAAPNTYSRVVSWVKVILPLVALALLSTLFMFSRTPDPNRAIPFADVDVEALAREQSLGHPRFAGTMSDGREVIFTAARVVPRLSNPNMLDAETIEARIDLNAESILLIVAGEGLFDLRNEAADLGGEVQLTTSTGFRLNTEILHFDMGTSSADAPGEVEITGPGLTLSAGSMRISVVDGNDVVLFNDGVRVLYEPGS
ncbi:LPS export ABC transporter periplasmic protein LptC [Nioella aestuarii]|uniref:LPS export ABC transporter periplasmic protein LptC n=1 Tax=Nioella aestuarii TaxID=1662864 RepID=UPI003D7F4D74